MNLFFTHSGSPFTFLSALQEKVCSEMEQIYCKWIFGIETARVVAAFKFLVKLNKQVIDILKKLFLINH